MNNEHKKTIINGLCALNPDLNEYDMYLQAVQDSSMEDSEENPIIVNDEVKISVACVRSLVSQLLTQIYITKVLIKGQ